MKIALKVDTDDYFFDDGVIYQNNYTSIIEWNLPILPRKGECLFVESLNHSLPKSFEKRMHYVWSVDYRVVEGVFMPVLWLQDIESCS